MTNNRQNLDAHRQQARFPNGDRPILAIAISTWKSKQSEWPLSKGVAQRPEIPVGAKNQIRRGAIMGYAALRRRRDTNPNPSSPAPSSARAEGSGTEDELGERVTLISSK